MNILFTFVINKALFTNINHDKTYKKPDFS